MRIVCCTCSKTAKYNRVLGMYYCQDHGFNTRIEEPSDHMGELARNMQQAAVGSY